MGSATGEFEVKDKSDDKSNVQRTIEFEIGEKSEEFILYDEDKESEKSSENPEKREERVKKLKAAHDKLKASGYNNMSEDETIEKLENQPAYVRKRINISTEKPISGKNLSRYRLSEDEDEGGPKLREDNSYLHDNVD